MGWVMLICRSPQKIVIFNKGYINPELLEYYEILSKFSFNFFFLKPLRMR